MFFLKVFLLFFGCILMVFNDFFVGLIAVSNGWMVDDYVFWWGDGMISFLEYTRVLTHAFGMLFKSTWCSLVPKHVFNLYT